jgi:hypothetical protein
MSTERQHQPLIKIENIGGLYTKANSEAIPPNMVQVLKNVDLYTRYGEIHKLRGNITALAAPVANAPPCSWIGFYKSQDFAGQIVRKTISQIGTSIYSLDGTLGTYTLTELGTGQPSGLYRDHDMFNRFMLITGQDPFITGTKGNRYKFDGSQLSNWGVDAPGSIETAIETFNNAALLTGVRCTLATEPDIAWDESSTKMTKTAGVNDCYVERSYPGTFAINNVVEDRAKMNVFIPEVMFRKLRNTDITFQVYFSNSDGVDLPTDIWERFDFRIGNFQKGWNTIVLDFSVFPTGDIGDTQNPGSINDDTLNFVRWHWHFDPVNVNDEIVLYMDHLVSLDQGAPAATLTGAGSVFPGGAGQTWSYVVTYENEYGYESNQGVLQTAALQADASSISTNVLWGFEDVTDGALTFVGTNGAQSDDAVDFTQGTQSIQFGHHTGDFDSSVAIANQSWDISSVQGGDVFVDVWIDSGTRTDLATDGLRVQIGDAALDNYYEFRFASDTIEEEGWTTLTCDITDPDIQVGTPDFTDVDNIKILFYFKDDDAATAADTALKVDNLRVTSATNFGSIVLTEMPISSDQDVIIRHIYRTVANGTTHFYVGTLYDNATLTFTDTTADASLGTRQPPQPGQFDDHSVPPNAGIVKVWKQTVFMAGDPKDPNVLYFSMDENPEAFPIINAFELDASITGIFESNNGLVVTTENDYWTVTGDNPDYFVDRKIRNMGNVGWRACGETKTYGWAHDRDCIRLYDLQETNRFSENIGDKIFALDKTNLEKAWSYYSKATNQILFNYQNASGTFNTMYVYQHGVDDIRAGWWWEVDFDGADLEFLCAEEIEDSNGDRHLLVGGNDGMVHEFMTGGVYTWVEADNTIKTMTMEIQTSYLRAGLETAEMLGVSGRWKPSFLELRSHQVENVFTQTHAYTVRIDTADGPHNDQVVRDTRTLTFDFPENRTLQRYRFKDVVSGEYVRINIKNTDIAFRDVYMLGLRIYAEVRPGQFPVVSDTPAGQS